MSPSTDTIRRVAGSKTYARGQTYARQGRASITDRSDNGTRIKAQVRGTRPQPYRQNITLKRAENGAIQGFDGSCTCPVGHNCKHVVAVLLQDLLDHPPERHWKQRGVRSGTLNIMPAIADAAHAMPADRATAIPDIEVQAALHLSDSHAGSYAPAAHAHDGASDRATLNRNAGEASAIAYAVQRWLSGVQRLSQPPPSAQDMADAPQSLKERLAYIVRTKQGRPVITPVKGRLKQDGSFGKTQADIDVHSALRRDRAPFMSEADMKLLAGLKAAGLLDESVPTLAPHVPPELLLSLLRQVAATGRAHSGDIQGPVLEESAVRDAVVVWQCDDAGYQMPVLQDKTGAPLSLLSVNPPLYLDLEEGHFGPIETAAEPGMIAHLLQAPKIPPEASISVAEALERVCGPDIARPRRFTVCHRKASAPVPVLRLFALKARDVRFWARSSWQKDRLVPALELAFDYDGMTVCETDPSDFKQVQGDTVVISTRDHVAEMIAKDTLLEEAFDTLRIDAVSELRFSRATRADARVFLEEPDVAVADSAAMAFIADSIPALREAGFKIIVDESWPYKLHEGPLRISASLQEAPDRARDRKTAPIGRDRNFPTLPDEASLRSGIGDWFSVGLRLEGDEIDIDMAPVLRQLIASLPVDEHGQLPEGFPLEEFLEGFVLYHPLGNDRYAAIETSRLAPLARAFLDANALFENFHAAQAERFSRLADALEGCGVPVFGGDDLRRLGSKLARLAAGETSEVPAGLNAKLRPYQQLGYSWLKGLVETGFGGVLADDMGLGKTLQALTLLSHLYPPDPNRSSDVGSMKTHEITIENETENHLPSSNIPQGATCMPSLLVVPTSLVGTWRREAQKFAPHLRLLVLHGSDRHARFEEIDGHDLIITTYPLLHRDIEKLSSRDWRVIMLDEAQNVKNPAAAVSRHIRDLKAKTRIALTGTPIENNLEDLWALFDWLIPGLLGDRKQFKARFRVPIERHGDSGAQRQLNQLVSPFMLRRTKELVAAELPKKTEIIESVVLDKHQGQLYEAIRLTMNQSVREVIAAKGLAASRITILSALLRLRQVCCDPRLLEKAAEERADKDKAASKEQSAILSRADTKELLRKAQSAKRDRLMEMLEELTARGRRVLVFSQFTNMLDLIAEDISKRGLRYVTLTGKTRNRDAAITAFQDGNAEIFLISLKAGGVGLTLTAADAVILYDPWWNPATERQAMDRTHRIGQTKSVFVYRLVTEGSVEERILEMQARKQALADALFEGGDSGIFTLDEAAIMELFAPLHHS